MSTGVALSELIKEVQYEIGHAVSVTVGQQFRDHIAHRIRREYKRLYDDFSWPHLRVWADVNLAIGTKVYTLPSVGGVPLHLDNLEELYVKWGGLWTPLKRGIEINDYNALDSDLGVTSDPAAKWAPATTGSETQIEIWPLPASVYAVRILAKKPFVQMAIEADTCALDDELVTLAAAAELLARQGAKEAPLVLAKAEGKYRTLKQRAQQGANKVSLVADDVDPRDPRNRVFVGVERAP